MIDTCGFPKDGYFYYRAAWTDEPVLHICSHWDYEDGDMVTLLVYSNCSSVELFVNGKSFGRKYAGPPFQWTPSKSGPERISKGIRLEECSDGPFLTNADM